MSKTDGFLISRVHPGSPASSARIKPGERLLRIDGVPVKDIIDFKIAEADYRVVLLLRRQDGTLRRLRINKRPDRPLGLQFDPPTLAPVKLCGNRCLFCFVDQNPPGIRGSLRIKDDDYRLSFLYGNFITLNNLTPAELERIIRLRLSPLYVSVHTTNPVLRRRMFRSERAEHGLSCLRKLAAAGIKIHAQIVLCPGVNDRKELERTVMDLANMGKAVASVAVVPVGLTAHRKNCGALRSLVNGEAAAVVEQIVAWQQHFLQNRGCRFVYPADELYRRAGVPYPKREAYEGFPQLENGVGMARLFLDELPVLKKRLPPALPRPLKLTVVTGREAAHLLAEAVELFKTVRSLELRLAVIENRFFGSPVTVAGLLTGCDILAVLKKQECGDAVLIPENMLKDGTGFFLDGMTLDGLEKTLGVPVRAAADPLAMWEQISTLGGRSKHFTGGVLIETGGCHCWPAKRGQVDPVQPSNRRPERH